MTTQAIQTCPEWCTRVHCLPAFEGDDFETVHFKEFGPYSNGSLGMVSVWAEYIDSKIEDKGVDVNYIEMEDSDDLRYVAQACLEAAKWMDEALGSNQIELIHGKE